MGGGVVVVGWLTPTTYIQLAGAGSKVTMDQSHIWIQPWNRWMDNRELRGTRYLQRNLQESMDRKHIDP